MATDPANLYPDGSAADLCKNDGHVNITREGKTEMNGPEGNVGDQSLAMPTRKTQPKQQQIEWRIKCCDRSVLTANNDESQSFSRNWQASKLQTFDIQIGCALMCMDLERPVMSVASPPTSKAVHPHEWGH